jgi:predicted RecA/RadA family phage recombinase
MKNQLQSGEALYVTAPGGGFTSGIGYQIGAALFGVAGATVAAGTVGVLWRVGVFTLPKNTTETWVVGDIIYWSPTNQNCTKTNASSDLRIGVATDPVTVASTPTGNVVLVPQ